MFRYIPAKVVSNSISKSNNFIMVNKGSKHGIEKEMGVVSTLGVAGIVIGVSKNYSTIMSMLHKNMRISARIKKSGQLVSVTWDNNNYLYGTVIDIPSHIKLAAGDTIVTSGNSLIFQEGIVVGTIVSHNQDSNKNLSKAVLKYITDFGTLNHVYVIKNIMKVEQDSLLNQLVN
jgi:rod shape-determining protein MreC